jgi:hypothetical protein
VPRLDHDNVHWNPGCAPALLSQPRGREELLAAGLGLHGGPTSHHITAVWELVTVPRGGGGFGCCPGTHTNAGNDRLQQAPAPGGAGAPKQWRDHPYREGWVQSPWTTKHAEWPPATPVHRVEAHAGSVILFTEKLKHGTVPWTSPGERRTLFYKYVPLLAVSAFRFTTLDMFRPIHTPRGHNHGAMVRLDSI